MEKRDRKTDPRPEVPATANRHRAPQNKEAERRAAALRSALHPGQHPTPHLDAMLSDRERRQREHERELRELNEIWTRLGVEIPHERLETVTTEDETPHKYRAATAKSPSNDGESGSRVIALHDSVAPASRVNRPSHHAGTALLLITAATVIFYITAEWLITVFPGIFGQDKIHWLNKITELPLLTNRTIGIALLQFSTYFVAIVLASFFFRLENKDLFGAARPGFAGFILALPVGILLAILILGLSNLGMYLYISLGWEPPLSRPFASYAPDLWSGLPYLPPYLLLAPLIAGVILPTICEEIFFRGLLLSAQFKSGRPIAAILGTSLVAVLLSGHGNPFPVLILNIVLGSVRRYGGNVWSAIVARLAFIVTVTYADSLGYISFTPETMLLESPNAQRDLILTLAGTAAALLLLIPTLSGMRKYCGAGLDSGEPITIRKRRRIRVRVPTEADGASSAFVTKTVTIPELTAAKWFPFDWQFIVGTITLLLLYILDLIQS